MAFPIDVGSAAINRVQALAGSTTAIEIANPANESGNITKVSIFAATGGSGWKVGTFYGSGSDYTSRDSANLPAISAGLNTITGLSIAVESGDFIGVYIPVSAGTIDLAYAGGTYVRTKAGDQFGAGQQTYGGFDGGIMSLYGEGVIVVDGAVSLSVTSALSALANQVYIGLASFSASCSIDVSAGGTFSALAALQSVASCSMLGTRVLPPAIAAILASASLSLTGQKQKPAAVALNAVSALTMDGDLLAAGMASVQVVSAVQAIAAAILAGQADIAVVCSIIADRIGSEYAEIAIAIVSAMTAAPIAICDGVIAISATSELELVGLAYWTALLGYTGTLTTGDKLVIDTDAMTVKLNRADARASFTGKFWQLWPGINEVIWTDNDGARNATLKLEHEPRWL